jgi:hypothetical protein
MNIMNVMKHAEGWERMREKNKVSALFFSFSTVWKAVLCSFSFTKFINMVMRRGFERFDCNFMNFMKIYEEGVFMAIFWKAVLYMGEFMNLENHPPSCKFINR